MKWAFLVEIIDYVMCRKTYNIIIVTDNINGDWILFGVGTDKCDVTNKLCQSHSED